MKETHKLPFGYTVTVSYSSERPHPLHVEWEPDLPHDFSPKEKKKFLASYFLVRDKFLKRVATELGENIIVVGTDGFKAPSITKVMH